MSAISLTPFGSKTYLFGEIPPKPDKHPLIPVLNFKKILEMREKGSSDAIDVKKELGSDYPEA